MGCSKGTVLRTLDAHSSEILSHIHLLEFSADSKELTSAASFGIVKIWDVEDGALLWKGARKTSSTTVVSPDGKKIGSGLDNGTITVKDRETEVVICTFVGHSESVNGVVFSPDGKKLASASSDCTVKIWNLCSEERERILHILDSKYDLDPNQKFLLYVLYRKPATAVYLAKLEKWIRNGNMG